MDIFGDMRMGMRYVVKPIKPGFFLVWIHFVLRSFVSLIL